MVRICIVVLVLLFVSCSSVEKKEEAVQPIDQVKIEEPVKVEPLKVEEVVNPCEPNPCTEQNKSICKPEKESFVCECNQGFEYIAGVCTNKKVLVLSVGAERGIAHIGAIKAFNEKNIKFDAVFGNSMGALTGVFYAFAPNQNISLRYQKLMNEYLPQGFLSKGIAYFFGLDIDKFSSVLNSILNEGKIGENTIPFATSYFHIKDRHQLLVIAKSGYLAENVARSVNNPLIFTSKALQEIEYLDSGFDRMSAIPVEDACELYGPATIYAINVTGDEIFFTSKMNCKVVEIKIPYIGNINMENALYGKDPDFKNIVDHGYKIVKEALSAK